MNNPVKERGPKYLNHRDQIIIRNSWIILPQERDKLDNFFLLHDTWANLQADISVDQVDLKRYLRHEGKEYEVVLLQPVRQLEKAADLGLSFRVHRATNIRVVLIKEWIDIPSEAPANGE